MTTSSETFSNLLGLGFAHLADGKTPLIVQTTQTLTGEATGDYSTLAPDAWPRQEVPPDQGPAVVLAALRDRPVLLVPEWAETDRRRPKDAYPFEDEILAVRPVEHDCVLMVLLPASALTSERGAGFRRALREMWHPAVVLYAAGVGLGVHPAFDVAALFLLPAQSDGHPVKMFRMPRGSLDGVEEDFARLLLAGGGKVANGYVLRDAVAPGTSLGFDRHHPAFVARKADLPVFGAAVPLGQLFDVLSGYPRPVVEGLGPGDVRVLSGKEIFRDGSIGAPDGASRQVDAPADRRLHAGDVVIRSLHRPSDGGGLVLAEVAAHDLPMIAGPNVLVLRERPELGRRDRQLALLFFRSSFFRSMVSAFGTGGLHVNPRTLRSLLVPQPDEGLASALDDLEVAAARFDVWRSKTDELLRSVFDAESASVARRRIVESGRTLRLRAEAGALLDDMDHAVRTRFPHPVAYRWRTTEAKLSAGPTQEAYEAVLDTAEVLICYAANVGLLMARLAGKQPGAAGAIRDKLDSGRSGPGLGDWTSLAVEIATGRPFQRLDPDAPLAEIRMFLKDDEADQARRRLAGRRNDQAHQRRVDPADLPEALDDATRDLRTLLHNAMFLADLPLIHVRDTAWEDFSGVSTVKYGEMMGDHPVVPSKTMEVTGQQIEPGSLYLLDAQRVPRLLKPFLVGRECPVCRNWSTFVVDTAPGGEPRFKSLEHGHTMSEPTLAGPLRAVGLLT